MTAHAGVNISNPCETFSSEGIELCEINSANKPIAHGHSRNDIENSIETCSSSGNTTNENSNYLERFSFENSTSVATTDNVHLPEISSNFDIKNFIKQYAIDCQQSHKSINYLLQGLKKHPCFRELPTDARTLLKTPGTETKKIVTIEPGLYYHFGLTEYLNAFLNKFGIVQKIELMIGIDGLPLSGSSKSSFWPILGQIRPFRSHIFMIGIYWGWGADKPNSSNQFLFYFVDEIKLLETQGLDFKGSTIDVCRKGFACDAPAKAFVLNIKGHWGYSSCTRGEYSYGRMAFPTSSSKKRTHNNFVSKTEIIIMLILLFY